MDKARILVVDDDDAVRSVTFEMLQRLGYRVHAADSGASALHALREAPFDLMLLDVAMPRMTGAEVFEVLQGRCEALPVIFMTGYAEEELAGLLGSASVRTSVLAKPFPMRELQCAVESILA